MDELERLAARMPWLIAAYFAVQLAIRLLISENLSTDEAEYVGALHLAWGYGNSHPPLYNWIVAFFYALTGYWPAAMGLGKHVLLAATYILTFDAVRRCAGRSLPAALAVAALALMPQVIWQAQIALSHSVLSLAAGTAVLHALILLAEKPSLSRYAWLGAAIGAGLLSKYNFLLFLAAALAGVASSRRFREPLLRPGAVVSLLIPTLLAVPHLIWVMANLGPATARLAKLERRNPNFSDLDVPFLGLDGILSMAEKALASAGPLLVIWLIAALVATRQPAAAPAGLDELGQAARRVTGVALAAGLLLTAGLILLGDVHRVAERYLIPVLIPLPFWLALRWPLDRSPRVAARMLGLTGCIAVVVTVTWPSLALFGDHRFAYPYRELTELILRSTGRVGPIASTRRELAANLAVRFPGASIWDPGHPFEEVLAVWEGDAGKLNRMQAKLGPNYVRVSPVETALLPFRFFSGETVLLNWAVYRRDGADAQERAPAEEEEPFAGS